MPVPACTWTGPKLLQLVRAPCTPQQPAGIPNSRQHVCLLDLLQSGQVEVGLADLTLTQLRRSPVTRQRDFAGQVHAHRFQVQFQMMHVRLFDKCACV